MKFGHNVPYNQIPGWEKFYINYVGCKKSFKETYITAQSTGKDPNFQGKCESLNGEWQKVELFYVERLDLLQRNIASLHAWYGINKADSVSISLQRASQEEWRDLCRKLVNLLRKLQDLYRFGDINRQGFARIICKTEKFCTVQDNVFNAEKLTALTFWDQLQCSKEIDALRDLAIAIWPLCFADAPYPATVSLWLPKHYAYSHPFTNLLGDLCQAIYDDDAAYLQHFFQTRRVELQRLDEEMQSLLFELLEYSILCLSTKCVDALIRQIRSTPPMDRNGTGNIFHRLTEAAGLRSKSATIAGVGRDGSLPVTGSSNISAQLLSEVVHTLSEEIRPALDQKDSFGRSPVHYAAWYGLRDLCQGYLEQMIPKRNLSPVHPLLLPDIDGFTPFQLCVLGGNCQSTVDLFDFYMRKGSIDSTYSLEKLDVEIGQALHLTLRPSRGPKLYSLARYLISILQNLDHRGPMNQTLLYAAARSNCDEVLCDMLTKFPHNENLLNIPESLLGWTPLIVACVEGCFSAVKLFTQSGADLDVRDLSGWTAKEHAVFRGHLDIAKWLAGVGEEGHLPRYRVPTKGIGQEALLNPLPARRRRLPTAARENHIMLTIGPSNTRGGMQTVDISPMLAYQDTSPCDDANYALRINTIGASGPIFTVKLPVLEDTINDPWWFTIDDPDKTKFAFSLVKLKAQADRREALIASGIAVLKDLRRGISFQHESLNRDYTIPLVQKGNLGLAGTVTFSFLLITALPCPPIPARARLGFWKPGASTAIVGHRGSGANSAAKSNLQIGENTIQSYLSAAALGASCVEFDVQLTKDWVPVIFHDFLVMETGGDTPLHTLTLNQFRHLADSQASRGDHVSMAEARFLSRHKTDMPGLRIPRSKSFGVYDDYRSEDMMARIKLTDEGMTKPLKGNLRGLAIQEMFPTFEELFKKLPDDVAFNIEIKYPMLWEAEDRSMEINAPEINIHVDTILSMIYKYGAERSITLSSFSPEICILLAIKQQQYPILFINKAGSVPTGDIRAANLQQAIRFAKKWNLAGIVMLSDPFVLCPRLVGYAKRAGLVVGSYGDLNDEPECAMIQAEAGLDAIIVNKVRLISQTLASRPKPEKHA